MLSAKLGSATPEQLRWWEMTPKVLTALSDEERIAVQRELIDAMLRSNDETTKTRACRVFIAVYRSTIYAACASVARDSHREKYRHSPIALGVGTTQVRGSPRSAMLDHFERALAYLVVGLKGNDNADVKTGGSPLNDWLNSPRSDLKPFIRQCVRNHLLDLVPRRRKRKSRELQNSSPSDSPRPQTHWVESDTAYIPGEQTDPSYVQEAELDTMLRDWWRVYEAWLAKRRNAKRDGQIISDVIEGRSQEDAALAYEITPAAVSQLMKAFYELYGGFWGAKAPVVRTRTT